MTLAKLFSDTDLGRSMDDADQTAFRIGAALAQTRRAPLNSMGVLSGYLLVSKPGRDKSEEALARAAWDAFVAKHPKQKRRR